MPMVRGRHRSAAVLVKLHLVGEKLDHFLLLLSGRSNSSFRGEVYGILPTSAALPQYTVNDLGPISGQYHMGVWKISYGFKKILLYIRMEYLSFFC